MRYVDGKEIEVDLGELLVGAARLASDVDDRDFWSVLVDVFDFMQEVDDALNAGEPVPQAIRDFAWWLGMLADFGVGMRKLQNN